MLFIVESLLKTKCCQICDATSRRKFHPNSILTLNREWWKQCTKVSLETMETELLDALFSFAISLLVFGGRPLVNPHIEQPLVVICLLIVCHRWDLQAPTCNSSQCKNVYQPKKPCLSGWWFKTFLFFPSISKWLIGWLMFFMGLETTSQMFCVSWLWSPWISAICHSKAGLHSYPLQPWTTKGRRQNRPVIKHHWPVAKKSANIIVSCTLKPCWSLVCYFLLMNH